MDGLNVRCKMLPCFSFIFTLVTAMPHGILTWGLLFFWRYLTLDVLFHHFPNPAFLIFCFTFWRKKHNAEFQFKLTIIALFFPYELLKKTQSSDTSKGARGSRLLHSVKVKNVSDCGCTWVQQSIIFVYFVGARAEWIFESTVDQRTFRSVDWLTPNNSAFRSTIQLSHRPIIIIFVTKFIIIIIIGPLSSFKIQEISLEPDGNLTHCSFSIPGKCLPSEISHLLKKSFCQEKSESSLPLSYISRKHHS